MGVEGGQHERPCLPYRLSLRRRRRRRCRRRCRLRRRLPHKTKPSRPKTSSASCSSKQLLRRPRPLLGEPLSGASTRCPCGCNPCTSKDLPPSSSNRITRPSGCSTPRHWVCGACRTRYPQLTRTSFTMRHTRRRSLQAWSTPRHCNNNSSKGNSKCSSKRKCKCSSTSSSSNSSSNNNNNANHYQALRPRPKPRPVFLRGSHML